LSNAFIRHFYFLKVQLECYNAFMVGKCEGFAHTVLKLWCSIVRTCLHCFRRFYFVKAFC